MTKLCKELIGHILNKWPGAERYLDSGNTIHENEISVTFADAWFISLPCNSGNVTVMLYVVTGSVKTCNMGYQCLIEYQIGKVQKKGQYFVKFIDPDTGKTLRSIYWPLSEVIEEIERQITLSLHQKI